MLPQLDPARANDPLERDLAFQSFELVISGVKAIKADSRSEDPETRRLWKKFQQVAELPEKDQRAVIRLINSLSGLRE